MKIAVLGSGSWGTALAKVLAENQHEVIMWGREQTSVDEINQQHTNTNYLKDVVLPASIVATTQLFDCIKDAQIILVVVPTHAMRSVMEQVAARLDECAHQPIIVHATKGLEPHTHLRMSQVIKEVLPAESYQAVVVLSGPSHAEEVARQDLTTITAASDALDEAKVVQAVFMNHYFRVYTNQDVIGVELGAALKNIIALGAGILVGLGYGDNATAGLVTRGLAEITRLGVKLGADPMTFLGLSGVGDLVVTCTSPHSRNWQAGNLLAQGKSKDEVTAAINMVVEGIATTEVAYELAQTEHVDLPITQAIYAVLYQDTNVREAIDQLMAREGKQEASLQAHEAMSKLVK
ncbi:NAD(P)H-dependent glycerol-3-phosphate dehydrogenase [Aerococcaceae bacterium zg-BR9]|uniref:NAD(P)H-dependent glycerol-3-phosphate dehydrogenase n=1 Tax=Aerococcaceae bacterium zg-1292 TaxID=2774330 RepID=UPI004064AF7D|nr:NAD(P)H-dependent glycerol-3-phosphate dehydrogenase [Aerococcaceae bacterium zg-BR9]